MTTNEIVGRLKAGGLDASSTNRSAAVYVTEARIGRAEPGWFGFRIVCDSEATERRVRAILSRWYDIDASGNVWRLKSKNRVPLMAIKRGGVPPTPPTPTGDYLYFEAAQSNSTVSMMSTLATAPDLEYSTDGATWREWQHTTDDGTHTFDTITLGAVGDRVYLRGDNPNGLGNFINELFSTFVLTKAIKAGGNVMSLLDKTIELTEVPDNGFYLLFCDLTWGDAPVPLLTAPDMSTINSIGYGGCCSMYYHCSYLTNPADMPSLTTIGDNGCNSMYNACTSLALPADMQSLTTIGDNGCNSMYRDCTSLTAAANMPALTIIGKSGCSDLYSGCTFAMSSDGTTFNFVFPAPPFTVGALTFNTYYDIAQWMDNTNGFTTP